MRRRLLMGKETSDKYANYMTIRALEDGLVVSIDTVYHTEPFYYCIHSEGEWKALSYPSVTETPQIKEGDAVSFKSNREPNASEGIGTFTTTRRVALEGNCMSLLYGDSAEGKPMKAYGFYRLFDNCAYITNVSKDFLPATTLANYCYSYMFNGVTQLTQPPDLPATTLAQGCYHTMFSGCSITESPVLPAETLAASCYNQMFYYCSKLNKITAMFTTPPSTVYTGSWVSNVASSGTFVKNPKATWSGTGVNSVPSGWKVVQQFTFKIDGIEYTADKGMTWQDWINSNYNDGFTWDADYNVTKGGRYVKDDKDWIYITDEIVSGYDYLLIPWE